MTFENDALLFLLVWGFLYFVPGMRRRELDAARNHLKSGNYMEALRYAQEDCKSHPWDWRPLIIAAASCACMLRLDEALQYCNQSIALPSAGSEGYFYRMYAYYWLFAYDEALADSKKVLEFEPGLKEAYIVRFLVYLALHEVELAKKEYDLLTELEPKSPALVAVQMEALAMLHHLAGRNSEAVRVVSDAVLLEPENGQHLINRAWYLIEELRIDEALADLEQAESLVADPLLSAYIESNRARARLVNKQIDEALLLAENALAISVRPDFLCTRAAILIALARLEEARVDLSKAMETDLYCAEAHWLMGRLLELEGKSDEAVPFLAKAASWNYHPYPVPF